MVREGQTSSQLLKEKACSFVVQLNDRDNLVPYDEALSTIRVIAPPVFDVSLKNPQFRGLAFDWGSFVRKQGHYTVLTREFIQELVREFQGRHLDSLSAIEICAGKGMLSHHLSRFGIDVVAIDDDSDPNTECKESVERLDHRQALLKYHPRVVLGNWIPDEPEIGEDVLAFPSVDYFIDIGEGAGNATWLTRNYSNSNFQLMWLEEVSRYAIGTSDYFSPEGPDGSLVFIHYTEARLWKRKSA